MILAAILLLVLYLFYATGGNMAYALERRSIKVAAMVLVALSISFSSVAFQTITHNRILTPAIMGFEAVYLLFQTIIVFIYGDKTFKVLTGNENFLVSVVLMLGFTLLLYLLVFKRGRPDIYLLLLIGVVLGTLFGTLSSFMQMVIDPNEFSIIEAKMFASFNRINNALLGVAAVIAAIALLLGYRKVKYLDVLALGRENAISLGVNYNKIVQQYLLIIAVLVSVSTALVGPITFLGILVTSLTYELFKTHQHKLLLPACFLVTLITLIAGQWLVEHVLNFSTTISIIINLIGGSYFLYLLMKTRKL